MADKRHCRNTKTCMLYFKRRESAGSGYVNDKGHFVLMKGSELRRDITKSCPEGALILRKKYTELGLVENYRTLANIEFSSSSMALQFLTAYSVSGPGSWATEDGILLRDLN